VQHLPPHGPARPIGPEFEIANGDEGIVGKVGEEGETPSFPLNLDALRHKLQYISRWQNNSQRVDFAARIRPLVDRAGVCDPGHRLRRRPPGKLQRENDPLAREFRPFGNPAGHLDGCRHFPRGRRKTRRIRLQPAGKNTEDFSRLAGIVVGPRPATEYTEFVAGDRRAQSKNKVSLVVQSPGQRPHQLIVVRFRAGSVAQGAFFRTNNQGVTIFGLVWQRSRRITRCCKIGPQSIRTDNRTADNMVKPILRKIRQDLLSVAGTHQRRICRDIKDIKHGQPQERQILAITIPAGENGFRLMRPPPANADLNCHIPPVSGDDIFQVRGDFTWIGPVGDP